MTGIVATTVVVVAALMFAWFGPKRQYEADEPPLTAPVRTAEAPAIPYTPCPDAEVVVYRGLFEGGGQS